MLLVELCRAEGMSGIVSDIIEERVVLGEWIAILTDHIMIGGSMPSLSCFSFKSNKLST